ncbi:MAG: DUF2868 domain-containing protein, partial [Planctomycetota bacterium]
GFNLAAVAGAMQLIVFSDLGFGWSTTLQREASDMHALTTALALPWQAALPDAVPPAGLVEATQTYRAENFTLSVAAKDSAKWWPFLVMAMVVYGVLPRFVTLILTRRRLKKAVVRAMATTPGADRVLERMTCAVVETQAVEHEGGDVETSDAPLTESASSRVGCVIRWAEAEYDGEALDAGGGRSLDEDRQTIAAAASGGSGGEGNDRPVLIRVKAWEPPVLEFLDFLSDLRQALGDGRAIEVQPIGDGDRAMWQRKLASVGDPWLRLVSDDNPPAAMPEEGGEGSGG